MTDEAADTEGWFAGLEPGDVDGGAAAIREGSADTARDWPTLAVEAGTAESREAYDEWLSAATRRAASEQAAERGLAGDRQLVHAVRAMDDAERTANELAERVAEWGADREDDAGTGVEYARRLADREPEDPTERRLVGLATRCVALAEEGEDLRAYVERAAHDVAPNLAAMAGPVLAARLIALAGGLESLAKMPSGTVQVLGAEDALFAHLQGDAPSPKHGIIYTHEYVRGIDPEHRGSAARAVAGKFTIAARIDHYAGDLRPDLATELDERIATIRARSEGASGDGADAADDGGEAS